MSAWVSPIICSILQQQTVRGVSKINQDKSLERTTPNSRIYRHWKASEELICSWISQAWKAIPSEMIAASLLKCGISKNSDGSQDELVYNSTEITDELDDSVIANLFESDCE